MAGATLLAATTLLLMTQLHGAERGLEEVTITATRVPEKAADVPAAISLVDGEAARARGAADLRDYTAGLAGVAVQPGGDMGPAGGVVAMQGLTEMDAYLLVVDGVPYGGAFNPDTATLDPIDLERVEVLRGAAPVMFGTTSLVGTLHLLHHAAGKQTDWYQLQGGSRGNLRAAAAMNLGNGPLAQSLLGSAERRQFTQDRGEFERYHLLWRGGLDTTAGKLHLDVDATSLAQTPYSPHPREGRVQSARFPRDANVNPRDARQDQDRLQVTAGMDSMLGATEWVTRLSLSRTWARNTRGFLRADFAVDGVTPNADGFRQSVQTTDVYFDTHLDRKLGALAWIVGADLLYGRGRQHSSNFEYAVFPDGSNAPNSFALPVDESTVLTDRRTFAGLYSQLLWRPVHALTLLGGVRLNSTDERRCGGEDIGATVPAADDCDQRSKSRLSGSVGVNYAAWQNGTSSLALYTDCRDTYKPAAIDFGPEAESEILAPETTGTWEAGIKLNLADRRIELDADWFDTRFDNLVIRENVGGLPALANAGRTRLRGIELELHARPSENLDITLGAARDSAKFVDYARLQPDGSLQQLGGNYIELSPKELASGVISYAPNSGISAMLALRYTGARFLNKTNSAPAEAFTTVDARIGWRFANGLGIFAAGRNLSDRRDAISESEIGDAQYYTLPGRSLMATLEWRGRR